MLRFGGSSAPPDQVGMPCPPIKYALVVQRARRTSLPTLHAVECPRLPSAAEMAASGLHEIVWSTTYDEVEDYAVRQFGEDGWIPCPSCSAIDEGDTRQTRGA